MRTKSTSVSDEELVAALLSSATVAQAAELTGLSSRTVYDRMRGDEFKGLYAQSKAEVLRAAMNAMNRNLSKAVDTVADIMNDPQVNPATRLQAAQTILNTATKYGELLRDAEATANRASTPPQDRILYGLFD